VKKSILRSINSSGHMSEGTAVWTAASPARVYCLLQPVFPKEEEKKMTFARSSLFGATLAMLLLAATGCQSADSQTPAVEDGSTDGAPAEVVADDHSDHSKMDMDMEKDGNSAKIEANLAKLSDADRKSAEQQKKCPVTGDLLGMMETPIKVNAKGRDVWICCPDCKDELLGDPDKYLAKLGK